MNKHFTYLLDEPRDVFFQKIAKARLDELMAPVGPDLDAPAPEVTSFAKIAMQVDSHLERLEKTAGPGSEAGMTMRAMAYFEVACDHVEMDARELATLFDKCAAAGIGRDIDDARREFKSVVDPSVHEEVDADLSKLAFELAKHASFTKEAFVMGFSRMGLRGLKNVGKGVAKGTSWAGQKGVRAAERVGEAARGVAGRPAAYARAFTGKVKSGVGGLKEKYYGWRAKGQAAKAQRAADDLSRIGQQGMARGTDFAAAGQRGSQTAKANLFQARQQKALQKQQEFSQKAKGGAETQFQGVKEQVAAGTSYKPQYTGQAGKRGATGAADDAAAAAQPKTQPQTTQPAQKPPGEGATTAAGAAEKKGPIGVVDESGNVRPAGKGKKGTGTEGPEPAAKPQPDAAGAPPASAPAAVQEEPKLWDSFKRLTNGEPISAAEKGALIRAGVAGAVGYRVLTGSGAVSGGEGLV